MYWQYEPAFLHHIPFIGGGDLLPCTDLLSCVSVHKGSAEEKKKGMDCKTIFTMEDDKLTVPY